MDKWDRLKQEIHTFKYSEKTGQTEFELLDLVERVMARIEREENSFLFTGIPTFDQKEWEQILEEHGLQGLS